MRPRVRHLSGDLSEIVGVTDIRQARQAQIFPLPSRAVGEDGNVVVTQYEPGAGQADYRRIRPGRTAKSGLRLPKSVPARVSQWKNALLDLSLRNKLINYTDRAGYRLDVPGPALGRFEDAVSASARITLSGIRRRQGDRRRAGHPLRA